MMRRISSQLSPYLHFSFGGDMDQIPIQTIVLCAALFFAFAHGFSTAFRP